MALKRSLLGRVLRSSGRLGLRTQGGLQRCVRPFSTEPMKDYDSEFWAERMDNAGIKGRERMRMPDVPSPAEQGSPCFVVGMAGGLRQYIFNRGKVGHSINRSTVRWLTKRLWMFARERDISCIVLRGAESKDKFVDSEGQPLDVDDDARASSTDTATFSVGTDHPVLLTLQEAERDTSSYYTELYQLVYLIFRMHKPFITYFNGRVGGNSAALGVNSTFRIATDESVFYLPQTGHGFFPDAGLTYFLSRMDDGLGMYLALTGTELHGADLVHAGIATHYQSQSQMHNMIVSLQENSGHHETVHNRMEALDEEWEDIPFSLEPHMDAIYRCFGNTNKDRSVKDIVANLEKEDSDWARETIAVLMTKSPIALEVTHKAIAEARDKSLEDTLLMEFMVAKKLVKHHDYAEGVTATLCNPVRTPTWSHKHLNDLTKKSEISAFFKDDGTNHVLRLPYHDMEDPYVLDYKTPPRRSS